MRIVLVEAVAEKWLLPRLASFKAAHPASAIELQTNHRGVDPARRDFDAWLAETNRTGTTIALGVAAGANRPARAPKSIVREDSLCRA